MKLSFEDIEELADSGAYGGNRILSGATCALLLSTVAAYVSGLHNWADALAYQEEITDAISAAINELMDETEAEMSYFIGQIVPAALDDPPETSGFLPCTGILYDRVDYPDLYAVLAQGFIEDADSFRTPSLKGRVPMGDGAGWLLTERIAGQYGGAETHRLTTAELAEHQHSVRAVAGSQSSPPVDAYRMPYHSTYWQEEPGIPQGGDGYHNNIQPFCVINYWIYAGV